jgi:flagellar motor switch/type III secretory pathway protein FliN
MSSLPTSSSSTNELEYDEALAPMLDVRCPVDIILGNGAITIRDILDLGWHTIVPLKQSAGSDLQMTVHNVTIASGEIVIVDESTALRVNRMAPPPGVESA